MAPRSQKPDKCPIGFRLEDGQGGDTTFTLPIRPEDVSYNEPALETAVETMGGAFVDSFGPGLVTIQISGTTGWGAGERASGHEVFQELYGLVWVGYYNARKAAIRDGRDPNTVRLTFIDVLNDRVSVVSPGLFSLKRNRSRPLLHMYQINMTKLTDAIQPKTIDPNAVKPEEKTRRGLASLLTSIDTIRDVSAKLRNVVGPEIWDLSNLAADSFGSVVDVVSEARGIVTEEAVAYITIARDLSLVGRNVYQAYGAVTTLPMFVQHQMAAVSSSFNNAFCLLGNAFGAARQYPDYDGIYGASNCSSTFGGSPISPLSNMNPWEVILPTQARAAAVTPVARANIEAMKATDPVFRPPGATELTSRSGQIVQGVTGLWR